MPIEPEFSIYKQSYGLSYSQSIYYPSYSNCIIFPNILYIWAPVKRDFGPFYEVFVCTGVKKISGNIIHFIMVVTY